MKKMYVVKNNLNLLENINPCSMKRNTLRFSHFLFGEFESYCIPILPGDLAFFSC